MSPTEDTAYDGVCKSSQEALHDSFFTDFQIIARNGTVVIITRSKKNYART